MLMSRWYHLVVSPKNTPAIGVICIPSLLMNDFVYRRLAKVVTAGTVVSSTAR